MVFLCQVGHSEALPFFHLAKFIPLLGLCLVYSPSLLPLFLVLGPFIRWMRQEEQMTLMDSKQQVHTFLLSFAKGQCYDVCYFLRTSTS